MKFNKFIFDLFINSTQGKKSRDIWEDYFSWQNWNQLDKNMLLEVINSSLYQLYKLDSLEIELKDAREMLLEELEDLKRDGLSWEKWEEICINDFSSKSSFDLEDDLSLIWKNFLDSIIAGLDKKNIRDQLYNLILYSIFFSIYIPHFFIPYFYIDHFYLIEQIFDEFEIIIPEVPKERDYYSRINYYFEICKAFYEFRKTHNMSHIDLCVFLYGFVGNIVKTKEVNLPKPLRVWLTGGSPHDYKNLTTNNPNFSIWAGNIDARPGDLQLIYFWNPISSIAACSQIIHDGFYDPFSYWGHRTIAGNFIVFDYPIRFHELKLNKIWSSKSIIKTNMQGVRNQPIKIKEFLELKKILRMKNSKNLLPEIEKISINSNLVIKNEKDVEELLLEPLLHKLGFQENDWTRQLSIRMGRGDRVYADYALFVSSKNKGEESANFLWEAKFRITNRKQLEEAFLQAKSYALRLSSSGFGIVAVEGIWFSLKKDNFAFKSVYKYTWNEINKIDNWSQIDSLISINKINNQK